MALRDTVIVHDNTPQIGKGWEPIDSLYFKNGKLKWDSASHYWYVIGDTTRLIVDTSQFTWYVDTVGMVNAKTGIVSYKDPVRVPKDFFHCPPSKDSIIYLQDPSDQRQIQALQRQLQDRDKDFASAKKDFEDLKAKFPWWWFALGALVVGWLGFKAKKL